MKIIGKKQKPKVIFKNFDALNLWLHVLLIKRSILILKNSSMLFTLWRILMNNSLLIIKGYTLIIKKEKQKKDSTQRQRSKYRKWKIK